MAARLRFTAPISERDVFAQLERLERAAYVPVVAGEAVEWLHEVTEMAQDAAETTCEYYRTVHPQLYQQISQQDPEQNARVQTLEQEDEDICAKLRAVVELAERLQGVEDFAEPDEQRVAKAYKELSDRAVASVLRVRKHETEISTWHMEAMLRDRGAAD